MKIGQAAPSTPGMRPTTIDNRGVAHAPGAPPSPVDRRQLAVESAARNMAELGGSDGFSPEGGVERMAQDMQGEDMMQRVDAAAADVREGGLLPEDQAFLEAALGGASLAEAEKTANDALLRTMSESTDPIAVLRDLKESDPTAYVKAIVSVIQNGGMGESRIAEVAPDPSLGFSPMSDTEANRAAELDAAVKGLPPQTATNPEML